MKQLLFLLLFPCFALAQYQGNGNQKITLGEQSTADGLVWRGIRADTTSKIVPFSDTSAYIILDTVEKTLWLYKAGQIPKWQQVGGSAGGTTIDTASMLTNYYRAGRNGIIQVADVPTLNQNTTGSAATLTTGRTIQTNLASTSAATFNGSVNITPGITGTLGGANGGTGLTTFGAAGNIPFASSTTALKTNNTFWILESGGKAYLTLDGGNFRMRNQAQFQFFNLTNSYAWAAVVQGTTWQFQNDAGSNIMQMRGLPQRVGIGYNDTLLIDEKFVVNGNARITGAYDATTASAANVFVTTTGVLQRSTSSIKYKTDVEDYSKGLKEVMQLRPVTFKSINSNNDKTYAGFIAEELADMKLNELVENNDNDEPDAISYAYMVTLLTKAIQEQQQHIESLKKRLSILENK